MLEEHVQGQLALVAIEGFRSFSLLLLTLLRRAGFALGEFFELALERIEHQ